MRFVALVAAVLLAAGCGQRGPLYLRDNPPPGVKPPTPKVQQPLPYPPETDDTTEKK